MARRSPRSRALAVGAATMVVVLPAVSASAVAADGGTVAVGLPAAGGTTVAAASRVYAGGSRKANRYMDIELQVLPSSRRANWRIDVFGPCTENERLGRTVGTDAGNTPPDPQLRISAGRFVLKHHAHSSLSNLTYAYQLSGHAVAGGFAGTFHYTESEGAYRCDSHLLHWRAHRTSATFP